MALNEGAIRTGDVLTFGKDPKRWVVDEVNVVGGKIQSFSLSPLPGAGSEGEEKG